MLLNIGEDLAHAGHDVEQIGAGRHLNADKHRGLAIEGHRAVVVVRAEGDVGHLIEPHHLAVNRLHHHIAKAAERLQIGVGRHIDLHHLALGIARGREIVVGGQGRIHIGGSQAVGREFVGVEPGAQGEILGAQNLRRLHAVDRLQPGLHRTGDVVGDLIGLEHIAVKADIHGVDGLPDGDGEHRLLRRGGQLVEHRVHLGVDLGERLVGVVVQPQVGGDGAAALHAARRHVVDAVGLRDGVFQRRGDETGHQIGVGAGVGGGDGDHGVLRVRILQHRQQARRAQAEHQNHQADHHGQYRTINEDVCEFLVHRALAGSGIGHLRVGVVRRLHAVVDQHRHAIAQLELPGGHHGVTGLQPAEHSHLIAARQPGGDEALLGHQLGFAVGALAFVLDQKDRRAIRVVGHGRVRQGDVIARLAIGQSYRGEHAGQQLALGVGNAGAHREVARGRVDLRLDRNDLGFEGFAGRRVGGELRLHAHVHQIDLVLRHGEVDVHRIERLQRDHRRARRQILAEVDLPNAQHARERRGDSGLRQHRLLCVDLLG